MAEEEIKKTEAEKAPKTAETADKATEAAPEAPKAAKKAKKGKTYIIYMNGNVAKPDRKHRPQPGCEIVVPSKVRGNRMSTAEVLAIGTSTASIATMIATLVNLFK